MRAGWGAAAARWLLLGVGVVLANFALPRLLPGSPLTAPELAPLPAVARQRIRAEYLLGRPWTEQFVHYLGSVARGDLGRSLVSFRPVTQVVGERLPWTLLLVSTSWTAAAVLGAVLGTLSAAKGQGRWTSAWLSAAVLIGSLPEFLVAGLLILTFSVWLALLPASGAPVPPHSWDQVARHVFLPVVTLTVSATPAFALVSRDLVGAVLREPFLLTVRAKGASSWGVLRHAWRCALPSFLTLAGLRLAGLVTGAAAVERVFGYPGLGSLLFDAVLQRDYPVIQGVFLLGSVLVLTASTLLEVVARWLDPRLR